MKDMENCGKQEKIRDRKEKEGGEETVESALVAKYCETCQVLKE